MVNHFSSFLWKELSGIHWGILPVFLSLPVLIYFPRNGSIAIQGLLLVFALLMASYDVVCRRIPNQLTAITAIFGLSWAFANGGLSGLGTAFAGGLTGFGLMAIFYFIGAVGGGDVKAIAALSVFLGALGALYLFVFTTLVGGLMAIIKLILDRKVLLMMGGLGNLRIAGPSGNLPYGLAIAGGVVCSIIFGL